MRIRYAIPGEAVNPDVLNAALETSTRANQALLNADRMAPMSELIRQGRVEWRPEPFRDGEHFDLGTTVQQRGWGDCDDLAPAGAAELRVTGKDRGARAIVRPSGPGKWHALIELSDGRLLDPSRSAGMGKRRGVRGSAMQRRIVSGGFGGLGFKRHRGGYAARCDLPIAGTHLHVSGLGMDYDVNDAIERAVQGAVLTGDASEMVTRNKVARALAIRAALDDDDTALEDLDDEIVGELEVGFLPMLASALPMASGLLKGVTDMIPGGGGGGGGGKGGGGAPPAAAASAPSAAIPAGGGAPVSVTTPYGPGGSGPVIVRF